MALDPLVVTLAVTVGAFVLFVTEVVRPAFTALLVAVSLMLLGVLTPEEGLSGPGADTTITVLCMFVLAAGIERAGLLNDVAQRVLTVARGNATWSFVLLAVLAGLLSAVLNNTPVVVLMIPLVMTVAKRAGVSPSRFLIPISFLAMLGGTMTLVGTSTNLIGSGIAAQIGYGPFDMFTFFKVGSILFVVGAAYILLFAPRLTPHRRPVGELEDRYGLAEYLVEVTVEPHSKLVGQTIDDSRLRFGFDVEVLRIFRRDRPVVVNPWTLELEPHDILLLAASPAELSQVVDDLGVAVRTSDERVHSLTEGGREVFEATVAPGPHVRGATLPESRFRQRFGALVLAIRRGPEVFRDRLHEVRLHNGDALLLLGDEQARESVQRSREFVMSEPVEVEPYRRNKRALALAIFGAVILSASMGWVALPVAALAGVLAMGLTGCVRAYEVFDAVDWEVIIVLVGLLPLGLAFISSGASSLIAQQIIERAGALPPLAILGIVYVLTFTITQIITNAAAVTVMIPVGAAVGEGLGLNPFTFVLAATFAGSAGFLTPIGYQTNLMVYGPGEYRFTDFMRVGAPLAIIVGVLTVLLLDVYWPLAG